MKFYSFTSEGKILIRSCNTVCEYFFSKEDGISFNILIVTPHSIEGRSKKKEKIWAIIHKAWENITFAENSSCLNEWRKIFKYSQEIAPGLRIFKLKKIEESSYFFLVDKTGIAAISVLNDSFFTFKTWHLIKDGMICPHGAGISTLNHSYLFLGSSGAGKSTVSKFGKAHGYAIIHDDHVVVSKSDNGKYLVADIAFKNPGISLKAIFFLVQDKSDKLLSLSQTQMAQGLFKSLFELPSEKVLYGSYLIKAFNICADIARAVPGYELHFTKSASFWKVIEDEKIL
jgi:hypothetical protein